MEPFLFHVLVLKSPYKIKPSWCGYTFLVMMCGGHWISRLSVAVRPPECQTLRFGRAKCRQTLRIKGRWGIHQCCTWGASNVHMTHRKDTSAWTEMGRTSMQGRTAPTKGIEEHWSPSPSCLIPITEGPFSLSSTPSSQHHSAGGASSKFWLMFAWKSLILTRLCLTFRKSVVL